MTQAAGSTTPLISSNEIVHAGPEENELWVVHVGWEETFLSLWLAWVVDSYNTAVMVMAQRPVIISGVDKALVP